MPDPLGMMIQTPARGSIGDILDETVEPSGWFSDAYVRRAAALHAGKGNNFKSALVDADAPGVPVITHGYPTTRATNPYLMHRSKPGQIRRFTPAEHARIKTAPECLVAGLPPTTAHEALGQGVIHRAFVHLGQAISDALHLWIGERARIQTAVAS